MWVFFLFFFIPFLLLHRTNLWTTRRERYDGLVLFNSLQWTWVLYFFAYLFHSLSLALSAWFNQEQKQLEKLNFEKVLEEKQREQTQLLLLNNSRKAGMLLSVKLVRIFTHFIYPGQVRGWNPKAHGVTGAGF